MFLFANTSASTMYFSPAYYHDPTRTYAFPYYVNPVHFVHSNYFPVTDNSQSYILPVRLVTLPSILSSSMSTAVASTSSPSSRESSVAPGNGYSIFDKTIIYIYSNIIFNDD